MESSKTAIEYAWDEICQKIYDGIELCEIHTIAEAIKDLECIEKFMETMDIESVDLKDESWLIKHIEDEIEGAERYVNRWQKTQTAQFKILAKQEWEHAGTLIKMIDRTKLTDKEHTKLQNLTNKYNELLAKLT